MIGTDGIPDRPTDRKRDDNHPDDGAQNPNPKDATFGAARELGKQLAKGVAFSVSKHATDAMFNDLEHNPDDNFFTRLLDWVQSL